MNRLLRCARENLRPVSLKDFQDLKIAQQSIDQEMLANRARELEQQLKGTFRKCFNFEIFHNWK